MLTSTCVTNKPIDLSPVFPPDDAGIATYVSRYRPGSRTLISKDADGKARRPYWKSQRATTRKTQTSKKMPRPAAGLRCRAAGGCLTTGSGLRSPQPIPTTGRPARAKFLVCPRCRRFRTVTSTATPTPQSAFLLRLTTVIQADQQIGVPNTSTAGAVTAKSRIAAPTQYTRERSADGKDHFQYCEIAKGSLYYATQKDKDGNSSDGTNPLICRDDAKAALSPCSAASFDPRIPDAGRLSDDTVYH